MNVVQIIPQLGTGGAERFVVDLCNELAKTHRVTLIVFHRFDEHAFFKEELSTKVRIVVLNKNKGFDVRAMLNLLLQLIRLKPDVVHSHLQALLYLWPCILTSRGVRFFHTIHNDAEKESKGLIGRIFRKFYFKLDLVKAITISDETQKSFRQLYNSESSLIYNGRSEYHPISSDEYQQFCQEINDLKSNKEAISILNVAHLTRVKNQEALAHAVNRLNAKGKKIELFIIGRIFPENKTEVYNSPYVHLLGERSNPRHYMAIMDAFCLASLYEGMPISIIEAFSVGAIPLCTPVGGLTDVIQDGINGFLAQDSTTESLENLLERFYALSASKKEQMSKASKESFRTLSMAGCAKKYVELFTSEL